MSRPTLHSPHHSRRAVNDNGHTKVTHENVLPPPLWWSSWSVLQTSRVCGGDTAASSRSSAERAGTTRTQCGRRRRSELRLSGIRGERYFSWCLEIDMIFIVRTRFKSNGTADFNLVQLSRTGLAKSVLSRNQVTSRHRSERVPLKYINFVTAHCY